MSRHIKRRQNEFAGGERFDTCVAPGWWAMVSPRHPRTQSQLTKNRDWAAEIEPEPGSTCCTLADQLIYCHNAHPSRKSHLLSSKTKTGQRRFGWVESVSTSGSIQRHPTTSTPQSISHWLLRFQGSAQWTGHCTVWDSAYTQMTAWLSADIGTWWLGIFFSHWIL